MHLHILSVCLPRENQFPNTYKNESKIHTSQVRRKNINYLAFKHRVSCILGQAFHYSPENAFLYIYDVASRWPATSWLHYTTNCNTQSSAPEDG